jgi:hypothetical protein
LSISSALDTTVTKEFGIFTEAILLNDFMSIAQENRCQHLDSPETDPAQSIPKHPGIERRSKRYRDDISYCKTQHAYSRLTGRIHLTISSLRNGVQVHLKGTIHSSLIVLDLTPHAYSIQRPILTSRRSSFTYAPTSRHAPERFILLYSKHILFLPECLESVPASTHILSSFRYETFRCRSGSSRLA